MKQESKKTVVCLDFDGVICDSLHECRETAINVVKNVYVKSDSDSILLTAEEIQKFNACRPYVKFGEDYYLLIYALLKKIAINSQADFDKIKQYKQPYLEFIKRQFYSERLQQQQTNKVAWLKQNPLYQGIKSALLNTNNPIYIITTKDTHSVKEILDFNQIIIPKENIFGKECNQSKHMIIEKLYTKHTQQRMIFVEDNIDMLLSITNPAIERKFAMWGYNNVQQKNLAKQEKIDLIFLEEFPQLIM